MWARTGVTAASRSYVDGHRLLERRLPPPPPASSMARSLQTEIRMRLVIENPVAGVVHSLQDKKSQPVDAKVSKGGSSLMFEFPIRIAAGPKFYGDQVRNEGPERRFVYIAVGQQAGDKNSAWSRRMKID